MTAEGLAEAEDLLAQRDLQETPLLLELANPERIAEQEAAATRAKVEAVLEGLLEHVRLEINDLVRSCMNVEIDPSNIDGMLRALEQLAGDNLTVDAALDFLIEWSANAHFRSMPNMMLD